MIPTRPYINNDKLVPLLPAHILTMVNRSDSYTPIYKAEQTG